jgi:NADPH2:quinone reductase
MGSDVPLECAEFGGVRRKVQVEQPLTRFVRFVPNVHDEHMRAALYRHEGPAAEVLTVEDIPKPKPGMGEVRVRMAYSAINPTDVKIRAGLTPRPIGERQIPHMDGSGVIDAVGPDVPLERMGERVWVFLAAHDNAWGTAAEWAVVPAARAVTLPADVPLLLAACVGIPAMTAAECLLSDGPIAGKHVLVTGGAGAVGQMTIALATHLGADVIATASTEPKQLIAKAAGARVVIDYRDPEAVTNIQQASPRIDRIVDVAFATNLPSDIAVSSIGTTIVSYAIDGPDPVLPMRACMGAGIVLRFMLLYTVPVPRLRELIEVVNEALASNALPLPPHTIFELNDIVAAHEAMEAQPSGRTLIAIAPDLGG